MSVFVFRRDVAGQRHAAPLQADGLAGCPAAPHGGGGRQEGGVVVAGCNAQGTTTRGRSVATQTFIIKEFLDSRVLYVCPSGGQTAV